MATEQLTPELLAPRIDQARRAGFSDDDIVKELSSQLPTIQSALGQGFTATQILNEISPRRYTTAGEVAGGAIANFPTSFGNLVSSIVEAITSPVQTAKSILDVGAGALQNVLPERFVQAVGEDKQSRDMARQVGQFFADRYKTGDALKQTIATDPAGVLADLSTILGGGAMVAPRAVAAPLSRAAGMVDPLALATRATGTGLAVGGRTAAEILGVTTGAGKEPIAQAFRAGREGGETAEVFRRNIQKNATLSDVLADTKSALQNLMTERQNQYRSGMINIQRDKSILDFTGIDNALTNAEKRVSFKGQVKDQAAFDALDTARKTVDDWKNLNPQDFHTPEGLDALKQKVGAILEGLDPKTNAYNTVNQVYNSIKSEIIKQAPAYANVMRSYTEATDKINEIQKSLSLGRTATADTSLRKLLSSLRDNVNANFGQRLQLLEELDKQGKIIPALAGISLSELTPRGLQRAASPAAGLFLGATGNIPAAIGSLVASSPRIAGEAAYAAGVGARGAQAVGRLPFVVNPQLYNLLYQSGQMQGLLGE